MEKKIKIPFKQLDQKGICKVGEYTVTLCAICRKPLFFGKTSQRWICNKHKKGIPKTERRVG